MPSNVCSEQQPCAARPHLPWPDRPFPHPGAWSRELQSRDQCSMKISANCSMVDRGHSWPAVTVFLVVSRLPMALTQPCMGLFPPPHRLHRLLFSATHQAPGRAQAAQDAGCTVQGMHRVASHKGQFLGPVCPSGCRGLPKLERLWRHNPPESVLLQHTRHQ